MKKNILKLLSIAPLALALAACGNQVINGDGKINTITRTTSGFNTIDVSGSYQVQIVNGQMPMVQIVGDENLLSSVSTDCQNRVLSIHGPEDVELKPTQPIVVKVTVTNIQNLKASGFSSITSEKLSGQNLSIEMSGNTTTEVAKVSGDNLKLNLSGDSHLKLVGQIKNLELNSSGNSVVEAKNLISQQAVLDLSGKSTVSVAAQQSLNVTASGDSKVTYYGNPKAFKQNLSGSAVITHVPLLRIKKVTTPIKEKTTAVQTVSVKVTS